MRLSKPIYYTHMRPGIWRALIVLLLVPGPVWAWGASGHRAIMERAIDALPAPLRTDLERHRAELVLRVNDPDLWRIVGWDEGAHHFLNLDADIYGPYPFTALPRDRSAAAKKFGEPTLKRYGLLPWRLEEIFGRLRESFRRIRSQPFAVGDVVLFAAVAAHYVQDAHQPLHATINHDGHLTNQEGLHARFESALYDRFAPRLTIRPAAPTPMTTPRDTMFDVLLESNRLVEPVLAADLAAARGRTDYNDRYYDAFFAQARPILERRVSESVTATASLILGAWDQAGRPRLGQ